MCLAVLLASPFISKSFTGTAGYGETIKFFLAIVMMELYWPAMMAPLICKSFGPTVFQLDFLEPCKVKILDY
jgi:hypothetical protein